MSIESEIIRQRHMPRVVVAGGGLAGLTAALRLAQAGCAVEVLESREILGGKVSSWRDDNGDWIESGLHVFFGAYVEIFALMRELGIYEHILWKPHVLRYMLAGGDHFDFVNWPLPSPLHLLPTVLGNRYFSWGEKLALARALPKIVLSSEEYYEQQDALTYAEWHLRQSISRRMLNRMFLPMALALKFVPPEEISARIVLDVAGMFLRENGASRMGFLSGSPQDKLIGPLADAIRARGGAIRTKAKVRELYLCEKSTISGVRLENGEEVRGDIFVLALPIHQLNRLIPPAWRCMPYFERLGRFEGVPVITAQLWLDQQVTGIDNILFCPDGNIPVFADLGNTTPDYATGTGLAPDRVARPRLSASGGGRSRIEAVVAPARSLFDWDDQAIVAKVWSDIQRVFPRRTVGVKITKASVVRIPQSVYWPKPGLNSLRPTQRTPIANLYLAGGYTTQRFYDSMEGAVASGNRAAAAVIAGPTSGTAGWSGARPPG